MNPRVIALSLLLFSFACGAPIQTPASMAAIVPAGLATVAPTGVSASPCTTPSVNITQYAIEATGSQINYVATSGLNTPLKGHFKVTGGLLTIDSLDPGTCIYLTASFDVRTATAPDSFMRGVMLNAMEADKYPIATLILTSANRISWPQAIVTMQGGYQLHNQQHTIMNLALDFSPQYPQRDSWLLNVDLRFNLSEYGIRLPTAMVNNSIIFMAALTAIPIDRF